MLAALGAIAPAAQASLSDPSNTFSGFNASTATMVAAFEAAVGGADNGTAPGEQSGGFRHLTWDAITVNGSDPGSTVVTPGHVVAIARSRAEPWGLELGPTVAVANDGFASVNQHAGFAPFSASNEWAPFNTNATEMQIVDPAGQASTPAPALTRGLGAVFLNVQGTATTIQYFNGQTMLGEATAPAGTTSFAGMLFRDPVVTRVVITLGTATMFNLDGTPGATNPVAGDDVVLAEPGAGQPSLSATAGIPVSTILAHFSDTDPSSPSDFTATIDWGDGARTLGTIATASGGGFAVTGGHAYAQAGSYTAMVTVNDFSGSQLATDASVQVGVRSTVTSVACSPSSIAVSATTTCAATVSDTGGAGASDPAGLVSFSSTTTGAGFGQDGGCLLAPTAQTGVSSCAVQFTPGQRISNQAHVAAVYGGDGAHDASNGAATVAVGPQRCTLKVLGRRLRAQGLGILVTCDARSGVQIGAKAIVARKGRLRGFQLQFGTLRASVAAARPTVLQVKPARGVLPALRAALRHHQHISLRLTLTASARATTKTTTTRVSALRLS